MGWSVTSTRAGRSRACTVTSIALAAALLVSCGVSTSRSSDASSSGVRPSMTTKFAPGLPEDAYLPKQEGPVPLVVLVPGGSWTTADPAGLAGLAADLAASCIAAAPTHIRVAEGGVAYPAPV